MNTQNTTAKNAVCMTLVAAVALATTMLAGVTQAATADAPEAAVSYQDLNLNTNAGAQVLYKRIQGAARQVCGDVDVLDLQRTTAQKACVARAVGEAVAAVNSPMLTQVSLAKSGHPARMVTFAQVR